MKVPQNIPKFDYKNTGRRVKKVSEFKRANDCSCSEKRTVHFVCVWERPFTHTILLKILFEKIAIYFSLTIYREQR